MNDIFDDCAKNIVNHDLFRSQKNIFSHGAVNIYDHSINVACLAHSIATKFPSVDQSCVIRAALLHDFFLYEWHIPGKRYLMHGWAHPAIAAEKAREVFGITDKECACIKTHMWPWTLFKVPTSREAWIISIADKIIAIKEALTKRGKRHKLMDISLPPNQV